MPAGVVTIRILGDVSSLQQALGQVGSGLENTARKMQSIGTRLSIGVTAPLALIGKAAVGAASDLTQSMGAVDSVFGEARGAIDEFAKTAAQTAGLSKREVNEMAAVIGASLKGMGFETEEAASKVVELEKRAADMAATFGGTTQNAIEAIASLMRGERDPIERYGVSVKQVDINARVAALGLDTSTAAAKKNSEAIAGLDLLMESTADTAGQFAREEDSVAGATARATAEAENAKATLGDGLQPIIARVTDLASRLAERFGNLSKTWQNAILIGGALLAALGPLVGAVGALITVVQGLGVAFSFLAANPVVLVIAAIAALAAGIIYAYHHSETFRNIVDGALRAVARAAEFLQQVFTTAFRWIKEHIDLVLLALGPLGVAIVGLRHNWENVWNVIKTVTQAAWRVIEPIIDGIVTGLKAIQDAKDFLVGGNILSDEDVRRLREAEQRGAPRESAAPPSSGPPLRVATNDRVVVNVKTNANPHEIGKAVLWELGRAG